MDTTLKAHFGTSASNFTQAITRAGAVAMHHIARTRRIRRDRQWLHELPDHMLRDIGISRSEIDSIVGYRRVDARHVRLGW